MTTGGRGGGTALARLTSENVARRLVFIPITVDDALNAYTVLETLNARGLELTTTDLLKNYLFAKASSADRPSMLRRWHNLLEILESRAEVFAAVKAPSHGYWVGDARCPAPHYRTECLSRHPDDALAVCRSGTVDGERLRSDPAPELKTGPRRTSKRASVNSRPVSSTFGEPTSPNSPWTESTDCQVSFVLDDTATLSTRPGGRHQRPGARLGRWTLRAVGCELKYQSRSAHLLDPRNRTGKAEYLGKSERVRICDPRLPAPSGRC